MKAEKIVLNVDDDETRLLAAVLPPDRVVTYSLASEAADYFATNLVEEPFAISFTLLSKSGENPRKVRLSVPGKHNVSNAVAALAAAHLSGVPLAAAAASVGSFVGLRRRMDLIGSSRDISVIDDFGHNPDKIAATLDTLHAFPGRLLCMFQPHGYGPLRVMRQELIGCFAEKLAADDILIMPDPVYYGGTADRTVGSGDIVNGIRALGRHAEHIPDRLACGVRLIALARPGDRIVIMGARDDSLSQFAADLLARL
jgi:UDP-N-acetylmuramate--alanine ligase